MPTYEYHCEKCRKNFELFQSMKDDALATCPKQQCRMRAWGKGKVRRLLGTGAGIIFKGSGFYTTDYRSEGYKQAAKSDAASTSGGGDEKKAGEPKTETKPTPPTSQKAPSASEQKAPTAAEPRKSKKKE